MKAYKPTPDINTIAYNWLLIIYHRALKVQNVKFGLIY